MKVVEIFKSIDGEGITAGFPTVFIRLAGCNLRCSYCDTKYSYEDVKYTEMDVPTIVNSVIRTGIHRVTLTGGEPLIHEDVYNLVKSLRDSEIKVNIETNGSVNVMRYASMQGVIVTMDYKCPSSGCEYAMNLENLTYLTRADVVKFVVGCKEDLDVCKNLISRTKANVFISPVFGKIEPKEIVEYMLEHNMESCRIQLQMHKYIWNPEERGV